MAYETEERPFTTPEEMEKRLKEIMETTPKPQIVVLYREGNQTHLYVGALHEATRGVLAINGYAMSEPRKPLPGDYGDRRKFIPIPDIINFEITSLDVALSRMRRG